MLTLKTFKTLKVSMIHCIFKPWIDHTESASVFLYSSLCSFVRTSGLQWRVKCFFVSTMNKNDMYNEYVEWIIFSSLFIVFVRTNCLQWRVKCVFHYTKKTVRKQRVKIDALWDGSYYWFGLAQMRVLPQNTIKT